MARAMPNRDTKFSAGVCCLAALFAVLPGSGDAQDSGHVLAVSKAHKLQVVADGGGAWCAPLLRLRMIVAPDSPDFGNRAAETRILGLLGRPITAACPQATVAFLDIVEGSTAVASYTANAPGGWNFTVVPSQAPPAQAIAPSAAAPDQETAARGQEMEASKARSISLLASQTVSIRLANMISSGAINYSARLDDMRDARGNALIAGQPVTVDLLIQAGGDGRDKIATKWPGLLQITVPGNQPALQSGGWYLVEGALSVPDADSISTADVEAASVYACTQPECADAADASKIVDHKIATGAFP